MIKLIVLTISIIGIAVFTVLSLYAVLAVFIARGFQQNEKDKH